MKPLVLSLALLGALSLTGCSNLISVNPIVTEDQAVMDPALLGTWTNADGKEIYWIKQDGAGYTIRCVTDSSDAYQLKARLMVAGEAKILDLTAANEDAFQLAVHTPARVWVEGDTLRLSILQTRWLLDQAGHQLTTTKVSERTLITSPSEAVRSFLAKSGVQAEASDEPEVLHRIQ